MAWILRDQRSVYDRFMEKVSMNESGCWKWTGTKCRGYGKFRLSRNPSHAMEGAHRASWMLFRGEISDGLFVCHKCDVRDCVNPDHLFLGDAFDNMQDASAKGRMNWKPGEKRNLPSGEKHPQAKLAEREVAAIRCSEKSAYRLAKDYGVSATHIRRIRRNEVWRAA